MDSKGILGFPKKVIEHFQNPRNVGRIEQPEGMGTITNPVCGDVTELYLRIRNGIVEDAKFHSLGCAVTIASASVFTEKIKGAEIRKLLSLSDEELVGHLVGLIESELGELPVQKLHCPPATVQAFCEAIQKFAEKEGDAQTASRMNNIIPSVAELYKRGVKQPRD